MKVTKAVILAAGLGTRMRRCDGATNLSAAQEAAAQDGLKAMIPIDRPFLDYVLSGLADVGYREICLVIGPAHTQICDYYTHATRQRLRISFALQSQPLGTADALVAAADFAGEDPFIVINSDNDYPASALAALRDVSSSATIGFVRDALIRHGNIAPDRVAGFAIMDQDPDRCLRRIVEKPDPETIARVAGPVLVSMNCWRFGTAIFHACRMIDKSPRGEYEIPDAVMYSVRHLDCHYHVIPCREAVLDLSCRKDVESVTQVLRGVEVRL